MRASVFIGTSLDGFIARENGDLDFLPPGGGEPHGYDEFMATVDALVIGRKTFETVLTFDAWPYGDKLVFVLSTRPLAPAPGGAVGGGGARAAAPWWVVCAARRLTSCRRFGLAGSATHTWTVGLPSRGFWTPGSSSAS